MIDDYSSAKAYKPTPIMLPTSLSPDSLFLRERSHENERRFHDRSCCHSACAGSAAADGHTGPPNPTPDHRGAWAADAYYGDTNDVLWTDVTVSYTAPLRRNEQLPGDGKFDNNFIPSALELAVGRVDFARMPDFYYATKGPQKSEIDLLVQYLKKDHHYRHKQVTFTERAVVNGAFGYTFDNAIYANALRNGSRWFGIEPGNVVEGDPFAQTATFLWGFAAGREAHITSREDMTRRGNFVCAQLRI